MAKNNPYSINEEGTEIRGVLEVKTIEDINDILPEHIELSRLHMCDCGGSLVNDFTIETGDKWELRLCENCKGLYGKHLARRDYGIPEM